MTTREMSGRTGECDFDKPDPLADEQQPIAALARRLHASHHHLARNQTGSWRTFDQVDYSRTRSEGMSR